MKTFTITTQLTRDQYLKLIMQKIYKQVVIRILSVVGVVLLVTSMLQVLQVVHIYPGRPLLQLFIGMFTILMPITTVSRASSLYRKNPKLNQSVNYTFAEDTINIQGRSLHNSLPWKQIVRVEEIGHYLLLYSSNRAAEIIDKNNLSQEQVDFIYTKTKKD